MKHLPLHLAPLALAILGPSWSSDQPSGSGRPDVLVVVIDDVAEGDLDRLDTPRLDGLASQGLRFTRAYGSPWCAPSRIQLMFGVYADGDSGEACDGTYDPTVAPSGSLYSLAELFRDAGYVTGMFGKWHLGSWPGVAQGQPWELSAQFHGFDVWRAGIGSNVKGKDCLRQPIGNGTYSNWRRVEDGTSSVETLYNTRQIADAAVAWMVESESSPWFALVCFQAPHSPFHNPPGTGSQLLTERQQYKLMAANLDKNIGRLLDQAGPSTVVCVVGDNGTPIPATAPAQDPSKVKTTTFEDGIRVPMIWYGPGITHGETDALASLADILPTMAEALSCATVAGTDGVSLLPVLFGVSTGVRWSVWSGAERFDDYALVSDRWKYREVGLSPELYDLDADPLETVNLYGTQPQVEAVMAAELLAHK